ncbi:hypothetical protein D018_2414B, partial [Vibrio parahaemolyticus VP2007-007]
IFNRAI